MKLKDKWREYTFWWSSPEDDCHIGRIPRLWNVVQRLCGFAWFEWGTPLVCRLRGHKWEAVPPEAGCYSVCERCGVSTEADVTETTTRTERTVIMAMHTTQQYNVTCPICKKEVDHHKPCKHFVGWTADGLKLTDPLSGNRCDERALDDNDHIVKTGLSLRVFRTAPKPSRQEPRTFEMRADAAMYFGEADVEQCRCCGEWSAAATEHSMGAMLGPLTPLDEHGKPICGVNYKTACARCHALDGEPYLQADAKAVARKAAAHKKALAKAVDTVHPRLKAFVAAAQKFNVWDRQRYNQNSKAEDRQLANEMAASTWAEAKELVLGADRDALVEVGCLVGTLGALLRVRGIEPKV